MILPFLSLFCWLILFFCQKKCLLFTPPHFQLMTSKLSSLTLINNSLMNSLRWCRRIYLKKLEIGCKVRNGNLKIWFWFCVYFSEMMDYNVMGGKMNRGLAAVQVLFYFHTQSFIYLSPLKINRSGRSCVKVSIKESWQVKNCSKLAV